VEIPRFVNIYGPGDFNFSRIIPRVINSVLQGEKPKIWDVGAVRDFLYIDDAISAYLLLAEKRFRQDERNRIFNFGTTKPVRILDLAENIVKLLSNNKIKVQVSSPPKEREKEILKQYVSIEKAYKRLEWKPKVSLEKGLIFTIEWYKKYYSTCSIR
jgi:CDP-glucose 4,6-dehydratase